MTTKSGKRSSGTRAKSTATRSRTTKTTQTTKTAKAPTSPRGTRKTPAAAKVAPKLVEVKDPVLTKPELRKRELIDLVVARSGGKKKDAKPAIEATLAILGEALADGRDLNLRPFGKLKISRTEEKANGTIIACRVRQPVAENPQEDDPVPDMHAAE